MVAGSPPTMFGVTSDPDFAVADVGATPGISVATGAGSADGDGEGVGVVEALGVGMGAGVDESLGVGVVVCAGGEEGPGSAARTGPETPN
jgi:hypothetical protein